jgi:hypothetical protein
MVVPVDGRRRRGMPRVVFPFADDARYRLPLLGFGFTPERSEVVVDDEGLHIRFGPWRVDTPLSNIAKATVTGPYRWWRAVGIRLSLTDQGLTFGTSTTSGVCIDLHEPVSVRSRHLMVPLRHPGVTVTVADPEGLAALLTAAERDSPG